MKAKDLKKIKDPVGCINTENYKGVRSGEISWNPPFSTCTGVWAFFFTHVGRH